MLQKSNYFSPCQRDLTCADSELVTAGKLKKKPLRALGALSHILPDLYNDKMKSVLLKRLSQWTRSRSRPSLRLFC